MELDTLRRIEPFADLSHGQLLRASRALVWRRYPPNCIILPRHASLCVYGLVCRGQVRVSVLWEDGSEVVEMIRANEAINPALWQAHGAGLELRAVGSTLLCFLPSQDPGLSAISHLDIDPRKSHPALARREPSHVDPVMVRLLIGALVVLFVLVAAFWQSPWRTFFSKISYGLASYALAHNKPAGALSLLEASLELNPQLVMAYNDAGYIYREQGNADEAREAFQQAVARGPAFPPAQNNLGLTYLEDGKFDLACDHLSEAVMLDPENVAAWSNLGMAERMAGHPEEAIRAYRYALRLDPNNLVVSINLGTLYYEQRQFVDARRYLQAALALQPDLAQVRMTLGAISLCQGDAANAWQELQAATPDLSDDPLLHFYLALWYEDAGLAQKSQTELERLLELHPNKDLLALACSHLEALGSPNGSSAQYQMIGKENEACTAQHWPQSSR